MCRSPLAGEARPLLKRSSAIEENFRFVPPYHHRKKPVTILEAILLLKQ